ncbi:MAG: hypothetical protein QXP91_03465 [Candidatus Methanomethylicia archaeon]
MDSSGRIVKDLMEKKDRVYLYSLNINIFFIYCEPFYNCLPSITSSIIDIQ